MKTENELKELRAKVESLDKDLKELSEEEFNQVAGGTIWLPLDVNPTRNSGIISAGH